MRFITSIIVVLLSTTLFAGIDMQAHLATDEALAAYTDYQERQATYYEDDCRYSYLIELTGDELFGRLNGLMGSTCRLGNSSYSYNTLRDAYVGVDRDLNTPGNIIGYYDGKSMNGTWDGGATYNREHTWPQSKGANKSIPMGHDMQSVRPTNKSINSSRGNDAYGENGSAYYDTDDVTINNPDYRKENLGSYRGDAARVILYDYIVYGEAGGHKNRLYNGNAQLLNKLGTSGVFESIFILLKWHMQDPPSLTEMVRNDGAQDYQGNRNPVIDFPELALQIFLENSSITPYTVTVNSTAKLWPNHQYTLSAGFVAYLTETNGTHPESVSVEGGKYTYDPTNGLLTVTEVTAPLIISTSGTAVEDVVCNSSAEIYNLAGTIVARAAAESLSSTISALTPGLYLIKQGVSTTKLIK
jgi:endonuclease I